MYDELEPLHEMAGLAELLRHYAALAKPDRQAWQVRLLAQTGADARGLTRLHGELIASGWIEQNTGTTVGGCYRVTSAGLRVLGEL